MARWLAMLVAALVLACAANASAQPKTQKAPTEKKESANPKAPLHLYLAKGEPNACGEGCSEWIAVEGFFDAGAAGRAQAFLRRYGARKLPVYLHSPGGNTDAAMALGRYLRQQGITAGVAATIPRGCESVFDQAKACTAAKRSSQPVLADWRPDGICSSACVWTLVGGKVRQVPPAARVGVHATKYTLMIKYSSGRVQQVSAQQVLHKTRAAEAIAATRRYMREMGIDPALVDTAEKTPHEDIHYLSRDQLAGFGIDRREFAETPWFLTHLSSTSYLSKWIVEARGPARKDYRISVILFRCSSANHAAIRYLRGLASDEIGRPAAATFAFGKHKARLVLNGDGSKQAAVDGGSQFSAAASLAPFDDLVAAAEQGTIRLTEADPRLDTKLFNVIELSTQGLGEGVKLLRARCGQPAQPASWTDSTKIPHAPTPSAGSAIPAAPYGAFPAPEFGLGTGGPKKK